MMLSKLWLALACVALTATAATAASETNEPPGLHAALERLAREGKFSGAVVIRDATGVRFERGYGPADPFTGRAFTPETPVDSGSLAKPVTAAAVLLLARSGQLELDAPVQRYLPQFPHASTTVRHLLAHSSGLVLKESPETLAHKDNAALLNAVGGSAPAFQPGTGFDYCNLCYSTLAMLVEQVTGHHYLDAARLHAMLPAGVTLRPKRLEDWHGRAVGYRRNAGGALERFDSWESEAFYGSANLSISAAQLAQWGSRWWDGPLSGIRAQATEPAKIAGKTSGLSLGSWYCAPDRKRCHYLGHHEGFHHMLYWDAARRISVAMVTNNALPPALHQRLQRALVAFAENRPAAGRRELHGQFPVRDVPTGEFFIRPGEHLSVKTSREGISVVHRGLSYPSYPVGSRIRYVPGLDAYLAGDRRGRLHWITLYEEFVRSPAVSGGKN